MTTARRFVSCAIVIACAAAPALGWWNAGHGVITEGAIRHLPPTLRAYFQAQATYLIAESGQEPAGKHYIDIDAYPEFDPADPYSVERDINALIALHGYSFVEAQGRAPWIAAQYIEDLTAQMSSATTANDWEALLLTAAELAHYLGDLHNPLHLTANYDGQLTGNNGIHARYEGEMIGRFIDDVAATANPAGCVYWTSPIDAIFDGIYIHYPYVDAIMAADTANRSGGYTEAYYAGMWNDTGAFTQVLYQEASEAVASAWYTAWVNAGSPEPIHRAGNGDCDMDGDVDLIDFATMQACFAGGAFNPFCHLVDFDINGSVESVDTAAFVEALTGPHGLSIERARQAPLGSEVTIGGAIITSEVDTITSSTYSDIIIQDDSGAIRVVAHHYYTEAITLPFDPGERLRISGTVDETYGVRQLVYPIYVRSHGPGVLPEPIPVSAADFADGNATAESIKGMVVELPCATFTTQGTFSVNSVRTVDVAGGQVAVWIPPGAAALNGYSIPTGAVDLVGILGQNDSVAPYDSGYQLWLREPGDITPAGGCP